MKTLQSLIIAALAAFCFSSCHSVSSGGREYYSYGKGGAKSTYHPTGETYTDNKGNTVAVMKQVPASNKVSNFSLIAVNKTTFGDDNTVKYRTSSSAYGPGYVGKYRSPYRSYRSYNYDGRKFRSPQSRGSYEYRHPSTLGPMEAQRRGVRYCP